MRSLLVLAVLTGLAFARPAFADDVYRWVDEEGAINYTNDPSTIPPGRRKKATVTKGLALDHVSSDSQPSRQRDATSTRRSAAADDADRDEALWRSAFGEIRGRIDDLEDSLAADRQALADPSSQKMPVVREVHGGILPSAEFEALKARIKRSEAELAAAREELAELERKAARKAIPLEWRR